MKILVVGGTFDTEGGKRSKLVDSFIDVLVKTYGIVEYRNGGHYNELEYTLEECVNRYDIVFWWPNVPNDLPKLAHEVKEVAPHVLLVSSKRNDNDKYSFKELVNHALGLKANLTFEFKKQENGHFHMMVFDPLGCSWYEGDNIEAACVKSIERLKFLLHITRNPTYQSETTKELAMAWYFDRFKENMEQSDKTTKIPDEEEFVKIVRHYAEQFQEIMQPAKNVTRFLGNASMRPTPVGRCGKGMPSFRHGEYIFVSQRNIDKQFIELDNFVPTYLKDDKVYYCGDKKPSVDTPVQLRLYERMPNINYMIHSHCYIKGAPFTKVCCPCGAVDEVDEICYTLKKAHGLLTLSRYEVNMIGHGSTIFAQSLDQLQNVKYYGRTLPERM